MPVFSYKGRNQRGEAVTGSIDANSPDAVATQLFNSGIIPIDINEGSVVSSSFNLSSLKEMLGEGKAELTDLIFFSRQMYTLQRAGVPIMQALRGLQETTGNPALAKVIGDIHNGLDTGLELSASMRRHPKVFSNLYVSLIQVGESTGSLDQTFLQLAGYLEREKDTRDRIKAAMRYPTFVIIAITIAMVIVNVFVIPKFAMLFGQFNIELPWATKILIGTSNFMKSSWHILLAIIILAGFGIRAYLQTSNGRYRWHKLKLKLPVVGPIIYKSTLGRFSRSLAMTIRTGIPLVYAMTMISRSVDNDYIGERVVDMRDGIERGETITRTAMATGMFPPLVIQMLSVGEESGTVDELLDEVGGYYERESDHDIKNLSQSIEPILIVFVGILVLILALGVFMPMWDMVKIARH